MDLKSHGFFLLEILLLLSSIYSEKFAKVCHLVANNKDDASNSGLCFTFSAAERIVETFEPAFEATKTIPRINVFLTVSSYLFLKIIIFKACSEDHPFHIYFFLLFPRIPVGLVVFSQNKVRKFRLILDVS